MPEFNDPSDLSHVWVGKPMPYHANRNSNTYQQTQKLYNLFHSFHSLGLLCIGSFFAYACAMNSSCKFTYSNPRSFSNKRHTQAIQPFFARLTRCGIK